MTSDHPIADLPAAAPPASGNSPHRVLRRALLPVVMLLVLAALGTWRYGRHNFKRLREVRPGVLYRMGQPSEHGLRVLARDYGVKTVVCLRQDRPRLKSGLLFDFGEDSGEDEATFAAELGIHYLHWPLGDEVCWPWPSPSTLEQFYRLMDDPANWPVLVHCCAGKHRAGTMSAIFRLEYDRWDAPRVLDELYSFGFGTPQTIQEHNLRTYLPRPRPEPQPWAGLLAFFHDALGGQPPADFETFLRQLRAGRDRPEVDAALREYVAGERPFAMGLAERMIESREDPLAPAACETAANCLAKRHAAPADWTAAAALVADFGSPEQKQRLLALLAEEPKTGVPTPRYRAVVAGVTNRYSDNRVFYLRSLLADLRARLEPAARQYRYADTAVARLTSIENVDFLGVHEAADRAAWDRGIEAARQWFAEHPEPSRP